MIRYIVHHEVLHRKIRNHKKEFYRHVQAEFKDYKRIEKLLLEYWFAVKKAA
jgi:predicted metal-dependent hydrolase